MTYLKQGVNADLVWRQLAVAGLLALRVTLWCLSDMDPI